MSEQPPKIIYLIQDEHSDYVWCDEPAPHDEMDEADAIKYIRVDKPEKLPTYSDYYDDEGEPKP